MIATVETSVSIYLWNVRLRKGAEPLPFVETFPSYTPIFTHVTPSYQDRHKVACSQEGYMKDLTATANVRGILGV